MVTACCVRRPTYSSIAMAASSRWRSIDLALRRQHERFVMLRFLPRFLDLTHVTHHNDYFASRDRMIRRRIHVKTRAAHLNRALHRKHQDPKAVLDSEFLNRLAQPRRVLADIDLFQAQRLGLLFQHEIEKSDY